MKSRKFGLRMRILFILRHKLLVLFCFILGAIFLFLGSLIPIATTWAWIMGVILLLTPIFIGTVEYNHYSVSVKEKFLDITWHFFTDSKSIAYSNIGVVEFDRNWLSFFTGIGKLIITVKELERYEQIKLPLPRKIGESIKEQISDRSALEYKKEAKEA